jgi:hypothetical protein
LLKYREKNWKYEKGLETRSYQLVFTEVSSQGTIQEQKRRTERLSLVKFIDGYRRSEFVDICRKFKKNDSYFSFDENKKFHITLLGFPSISPVYYDRITQKINEFIESTQTELTVKFDLIRLGTKYENKDYLKPVYGDSNGTIISLGRSASNKRFTTYGNSLTSFLLRDKNLHSVLGKTFRRRFPTVWCTMGYYTRDFTITKTLESLFKKYDKLDGAKFKIPCFKFELGLSHYKDLRDWKSIRKFELLKSSN